MGFLLLSATYAILTVAALVIVRMSGGVDISISNSIFNIKLSSKMIVGLVIYVISFVLYLFIIPRLTFTNTFPILNGAVYMLIVMSGVFIFHEKITLQHVVGIALILAGIIVLGMIRTGDFM